MPVEVWNKGPVAANRWIKEHLLPEPKTSEASQEKAQESELLKQKAAPFAFRVINGKIDVAPEDAVSIDEHVARDFHAEAKRKAAELKERLARAQADKRLQDSLARLEQYLGENVEDIRPGLILSALRSLNPTTAPTTPRKAARNTRPNYWRCSTISRVPCAISPPPIQRRGR